MGDLTYLKTLMAGKGYILGGKISKGSFATVRSCQKKDEPAILAVKIIDKAKAPEDFLKSFLPKELDISMSLKHKNIIGTYTAHEIGWYTCIIMEKAQRDMLGLITDTGPMEENDAKPLFAEFMEGMKYMHDLGISHRDIKLENILLDKQGHVKIADFGFARYVEDPETKKRKLSETFCGSAAYAAPEILKGSPYNPLMSDVWSSGVVLYILLNGIMPFDDTDHVKLLRDQIQKRWTWNPDRKTLFSPTLRRMMRSMLEPDITARATLKKVSQNEWFTKSDGSQGSDMATMWKE